MKKIRIIIAPDGMSAHTEAEGFKGKACVNPIAKLSEKLGTTSDSGDTKELYETERSCEECF